MNISITVIYNDKEQIERLDDIMKKYPLKYHLIDSKTKKGKKEAAKLKSFLAAKLEPFIVVIDEDEDKPIRAFYTEAEDVITKLTKYLYYEHSSESSEQVEESATNV